MTEKELWADFIKKHPDYKETEYDAWAFGGGDESADTLAKLVYDGIKTATASAHDFYEIENEPLPPFGGLNIILDSNDQAVCITETTKVYICPFDEISEEQAYLEGEGDRSLAYWRQVHEDFFTKEMHSIGKEFHEKMLVVCEEFKVIYK